MELAASLPASKIARLALIGVGTAFAWIILSLALGISSTDAHANETDDDSALGAVTSLLGATTSTVTGGLGAVVDTATSAVSSVVAVTPAPVQQPVQQVTQTVAAIVAPVQQIADSGVVSAVVAPVVGIVQRTPVVGQVVGALGLDAAVTDVTGTVDGALSDTVGIVGSVTELAPPTTPPLTPAPGDLPDTYVSAMDASATAFATPETARTAQSLHARSITQPEGAASPTFFTATAVSTTSTPSSQPLPGGLCPSATSSGPGGAGPGALGLLAFAPFAAHRAWVRRSARDDEDAPPAPPGSTDVSPD